MSNELRRVLLHLIAHGTGGDKIVAGDVMTLCARMHKVTNRATGKPPGPPTSPLQADSISALVNLGFAKREAATMVGAAIAEGADSIEAVVRAALQAPVHTSPPKPKAKTPKSGKQVPVQALILAALEGGPKLRGELYEIVPSSRNSISSALTQLMRKGLVTHPGGRGSPYSLVKP